MSSDELPRLLSLLSHELRGPLGVVRGYLKLLEQRGTELSEQHLRAITAALRATDRAAAVLDQASKLAQLNRDEMHIELTRVSLDLILDDAVRKVTLPENPVIKLRRGGPCGEYVLADAQFLSDVFTTLIGAIARAQPKAATISTVCTLEPFETRDGIVIELVTSPEGESTRRAFDISRGGLGLELPIAARVIAAHGGTIEDLRDGERPTGFRVWLPRAE